MLKLSTLPTNIRLVWKTLPVRDTLAYYGMLLIMTVKSVVFVIVDILILSTLPTNTRLGWKILSMKTL